MVRRFSRAMDGKHSGKRKFLQMKHRFRLHAALLFAALWVAVAAGVLASMTPEEKEALRSAADEADKSIRHLAHADVPTTIAKGVHILFFGAVWCKYTQRFTPKWLEVQKEADAKGWNTVEGFGYFKVECSENESYCIQNHHTDTGYPTINLYVNGAYVEEYLGMDDVAPTLDYLGFQLTTKAKNATALSDLSTAPKYPGYTGPSPAAEGVDTSLGAKAAAAPQNSSSSEASGSGSGSGGGSGSGWSVFGVLAVAAVGAAVGYVHYRKNAGGGRVRVSDRDA